MSGALARHAATSLAACTALIPAACAARTSSTASRPAAVHHPGDGRGAPVSSGPARDTFGGSIISATGAYSAYRGRVRIYLQPHGSGPGRTLRVLLRADCGARARCPKLNGTLTGTLTAAARHLPDTGNRDVLTGAGQVSPLGSVRARGWVQGTGFIAHGHELLQITLTTRSGSVTLQAVSAPVKGFSSP